MPAIEVTNLRAETRIATVHNPAIDRIPSYCVMIDGVPSLAHNCSPGTRIINKMGNRRLHIFAHSDRADYIDAVLSGALEGVTSKAGSGGRTAYQHGRNIVIDDPANVGSAFSRPSIDNARDFLERWDRICR